VILFEVFHAVLQELVETPERDINIQQTMQQVIFIHTY